LLLKKGRGYAIILALLILAPLMLSAEEALLGLSTGLYVADVDLQEALAFAAKAAAGQVAPASQASGTPRVHCARAHAAFRDALARNLGLDPATLAPLSGSQYAAVRYRLVVYNGLDDYAWEGALGARMYQFDGSGPGTEAGFPYSGFPAKFAVTGSGVSWGPGGIFTVTLESPGVVVWGEARARRVLGQGDITSQRWAAARIVCREGTCRVR
jgi:hypothetical protein